MRTEVRTLQIRYHLSSFQEFLWVLGMWRAWSPTLCKSRCGSSPGILKPANHVPASQQKSGFSAANAEVSGSQPPNLPKAGGNGAAQSSTRDSRVEAFCWFEQPRSPPALKLLNPNPQKPKQPHFPPSMFGTCFGPKTTIPLQVTSRAETPTAPKPPQRTRL